MAKPLEDQSKLQSAIDIVKGVLTSTLPKALQGDQQAIDERRKFLGILGNLQALTNATGKLKGQELSSIANATQQNVVNLLNKSDELSDEDKLALEGLSKIFEKKNGQFGLGKPTSSLSNFQDVVDAVKKAGQVSEPVSVSAKKAARQGLGRTGQTILEILRGVQSQGFSSFQKDATDLALNQKVPFEAKKTAELNIKGDEQKAAKTFNNLPKKDFFSVIKHFFGDIQDSLKEQLNSPAGKIAVAQILSATDPYFLGAKAVEELKSEADLKTLEQANKLQQQLKEESLQSAQNIAKEQTIATNTRAALDFAQRLIEQGRTPKESLRIALEFFKKLGLEINPDAFPSEESSQQTQPQSGLPETTAKPLLAIGKNFSFNLQGEKVLVNGKEQTANGKFTGKFIGIENGFHVFQKADGTRVSIPTSFVEGFIEKNPNQFLNKGDVLSTTGSKKARGKKTEIAEEARKQAQQKREQEKIEREARKKTGGGGTGGGGGGTGRKKGGGGGKGGKFAINASGITSSSAVAFLTPFIEKSQGKKGFSLFGKKTNSKDAAASIYAIVNSYGRSHIRQLIEAFGKGNTSLQGAILSKLLSQAKSSLQRDGIKPTKELLTAIATVYMQDLQARVRPK